MIINGKEVEVDFRNAEKIQKKIDVVPQIPDSAKVEVNKADLKEINYFDDSTFSGYSMQNNTLLTGSRAKENRKQYYETFNDMANTNFIQRGLQIIADDCTQKNEDGQCLSIRSDDDEIKEILEKLFHERLNMNKELWSIFYETCKIGDNFYEVIPDSYKNPTMIARIRYLEADRVNRIEKNGKLAFYTYTTDATDPEQLAFQIDKPKASDEEKAIYKLEPWQIIHFRITDKDFHPYGGSLLKAGVKTFKRLQLLEDGMMIYRLARVPERRVFKVDVGNLPQSEVNRQMQKIKDNYRTTQILDDRGNINRTASALSITQDIFIPVRDGGRGTDITTLSPGVALNNIDDIRYFRDQILWTLNIPPEYLGTTSDQGGASAGRGSLAMQDIKFSRFAQRIQYYIEEGLTKIASIELFFKKKKKEDLRNFKIELTPPSNIKEIMDIEYINQKMTLIQSMIGTGLFPKKFILKYVMKMSKKEIDNLIFFKDLEVNNGADNNMDMGMGGGMPMDAGTPPMDAGAQPPMPDNNAADVALPSVKTEEVDTKKLVKLFGKEFLVENKEDFAKLIKAAEEYNESLNKPVKEEIIEEEIENSNFIKIISESMGNKELKYTNSISSNLVFENELGGLNFNKNEFGVFESKKRSGPKSNKTSDLVFEEKITKF